MSVIGAIVVVFVTLVAIGVLGIVISIAATRSRRNRFESQVREFRQSGCTCDYTFVEAWGTTNVTRRHDCPVHGRKGTNG
jgi:hypothetical protein